MIASGDQLASVSGEKIQWEPCLSRWSGVNTAREMYRVGGDSLLARVSVGIQASEWVQLSPKKQTWNWLTGASVQKRTIVMHAAISPSEMLLLHKDIEWDGAVTVSFHRVGKTHTKLPLKLHRTGCLSKGSELRDFDARSDGAALVCELGVEEWSGTNRSGSRWRNRFTPLPKAMAVNPFGADNMCKGEPPVSPWVGLAHESGGYEVIAPSLRGGGTHIGKLDAGKWSGVRLFSDQVVSAYVQDDKGAWFTTVRNVAGGACETQLWRRDAAGNNKIGAAVHGGKVWLLIDPAGFPTVVTSFAMLTKSASGEEMLPLETERLGPKPMGTERVENATMMDGAVWLEFDGHGWRSRRSYTELGAPNGTCP